MSNPPQLPKRATLVRAVTERDADWDGLFWYGVSTTGIVCCPSCPSRRARSEHLSFYATLAEAHLAGLRSCLRCHPERATVPEWQESLERLVTAAGTRRVTDHDLTAAGLNPVTVRRHFQRSKGTTFHQWSRSQQLANAHRKLKEGTMLDEVIVDSGWASHSGFRTAFAKTMGIAPGKARHNVEPLITKVIDSPVGALALAAIDAGVVLLEFGNLSRLQEQAPRLQRHFPGPIVNGNHPHLDLLTAELAEYFAGTRKNFSVPLVVRGTAFEERVWRALLEIPYGTTCSYGDIARAVDSPKAVRAVGSANGRNRLAIVIPCHRVLNTGGALGGYGGGLWRKQRLLEIEEG